MNKIENTLEALIQKSVKVRHALSDTLIKNFPIEKEFADFLALEIVNQAIGTDALERYNNSIILKKQKAEKLEENKQKAAYRLQRNFKIKHILTRVLQVALILVIISSAVFGIYSCNTISPYPRVYKPIAEKERFVDVERSRWSKTNISGLHDANNLCVADYSSYSRSGGISATNTTCIHRNKVERLNSALQRSVETDFNGVVWNEPNGNGELWSVVRNNYRFVITATNDESFVKP